MADPAPKQEHETLLVTGGYDHTIRLWNVNNGSCLRTLQHADSQVNDLKITPDRKNVSVAGHGQIRFYDINSNSPSPVLSFEGHVGNVTSVGFSEDGTWMHSGGQDKTVKIWDVRSSSDCQRDFNHENSVTCVALHPNQTELISGDQDGRIVRWDLRANQCTEHLIPELDTAVRSIAISSDARLLAGVNNKGNCYIWQLNGSDVCPLKMVKVHHPAYALKCKFSPDGTKFVTTSSDRTAKIWDVDAEFAPLATLAGHKMWVWDAVFSADSSLLVTASSDTTVRVWDAAEGSCVQELKGHQRAVTAVALSDSA